MFEVIKILNRDKKNLSANQLKKIKNNLRFSLKLNVNENLTIIIVTYQT